MKSFLLAGSVLLIAASAFAHVGVIPTQSTPGATETYKLRVPSEGGRTTTAVVLTVPDGVTITSVTVPEGAKHEEKRTGDRIVEVTWTVEIKAGARAELPFVARNPTEGSSITWKVIQKYSDGSSSAWVGPRRDRAPAPVTKLAVAAHETDSMKIPDSLEGIFKVIYEKHAALTNDVRNKNLKAVHTHAENLQTLAKALPAKASKENTSRVEGAVNNVIKVTDELHQAADAGEQVKTEANLKKLDGLLKVLQTQFGMKMEEAGEHKR